MSSDTFYHGEAQDRTHWFFDHAAYAREVPSHDGKMTIKLGPGHFNRSLGNFCYLSIQSCDMIADRSIPDESIILRLYEAGHTTAIGELVPDFVEHAATMHGFMENGPLAFATWLCNWREVENTRMFATYGGAWLTTVAERAKRSAEFLRGTAPREAVGCGNVINVDFRRSK